MSFVSKVTVNDSDESRFVYVLNGMDIVKQYGSVLLTMEQKM
jgi:hypothetical protein